MAGDVGLSHHTPRFPGGSAWKRCSGANSRRRFWVRHRSVISCANCAVAVVFGSRHHGCRREAAFRSEQPCGGIVEDGKGAHVTAATKSVALVADRARRWMQEEKGTGFGKRNEKQSNGVDKGRGAGHRKLNGRNGTGGVCIGVSRGTQGEVPVGRSLVSEPSSTR